MTERKELPEAPASLNFIMDLRTKEVTSMQITLRDFDEISLVERGKGLFKYLGINAPAQPEPMPEGPEEAPYPTWEQVGKDAKEILYGPEEEEKPTVEILDKPTAEVQFTSSGIRHLKVRGGRWTKYGVIAWPEVVTFDGWEDWEVGPVYQLNKRAVIQMKDKDGRLVPDKVLRFE